MPEDRMVIIDGVVAVGTDGTVSNIDFQNCQITIGKDTRLLNCSIDIQCEVIFNG